MAYTHQIQRFVSEPQTSQNSSFSAASTPLERPTTPAWEYLHTGQLLSFHLLKQEQWNTCWQRIVSSPVVSSILSRHTGHVGNSNKEGVGGGTGLVEMAVGVAREVVDGSVVVGENGSLSMLPGKLST